MRIEVTAEDIAAGCRRDRFGCPLARAAARVVGKSLDVDRATISWQADAPSHGFVTLYLPPDVWVWVLGFDHGARSSPITFDLPDPAP